MCRVGRRGGNVVPAASSPSRSRSNTASGRHAISCANSRTARASMHAAATSLTSTSRQSIWSNMVSAPAMSSQW